jgi:hypothetical protein
MLYDYYDEPAEPASVARADNRPRGRHDSPRKLLGVPTDSGGELTDADAEPFRHEVAKRVEGDRPGNEPGPREPGADEAPQDNVSPGATEDRLVAGEPAEDKPSPRTPIRERPPTDSARRSAEREARMEELKKRSDERAAERKKRREKMTDVKNRSDEKVAAALLKNAEISHKLGNLELYRQRLKQIAERYPETEAGKKAAELLE